MRTLIFLACITLVIAFAPSTARADVTIERKPATVERRTFDPAHPPSDMPPLKENEAALTESKFDCKVGMNYRVISHKHQPDGCEATLQVQGIHVDLELTVTIWLPENAPAKLVAHEEGHRRIAERIYAGAEQIARAIAKPLDGKRVTAIGPDCAAADKQASDSAATDFCKEYLRQTVTATSRVGGIYDDLTAHGTRAEPAEDEAIRQAFRRVEEEAQK